LPPDQIGGIDDDVGIDSHPDANLRGQLQPFHDLAVANDDDLIVPSLAGHWMDHVPGLDQDCVALGNRDPGQEHGRGVNHSAPSQPMDVGHSVLSPPQRSTRSSPR
jgi:hypothetical protein